MTSFQVCWLEKRIKRGFAECFIAPQILLSLNAPIGSLVRVVLKEKSTGKKTTQVLNPLESKSSTLLQKLWVDPSLTQRVVSTYSPSGVVKSLPFIAFDENDLSLYTNVGSNQTKYEKGDIAELSIIPMDKTPIWSTIYLRIGHNIKTLHNSSNIPPPHILKNQLSQRSIIKNGMSVSLSLLSGDNVVFTCECDRGEFSHLTFEDFLTEWGVVGESTYVVFKETESLRPPISFERTEQSKTIVDPTLYSYADEPRDRISFLIDTFLHYDEQKGSIYGLNLGRPHAVILIGSEGLGKTTLLKKIVSCTKLRLLSLSAWELSKDFSDSPEEGMDFIFASASTTPSVILIPNIHVLFPTTDGDFGVGGLTNDIDIANKLASKFKFQMDRISKQSLDIMVIGTTSRVDLLHKSVKAQFEDEIKFEVPTPQKRLQILECQLYELGVIKNLPGSSISKEITNDLNMFDGVDVVLSEDFSLISLSHQLYGFNGSDIARLCHTVISNAYCNLLKTNPDDNIAFNIPTITLTIKDFLDAKKEINVVSSEKGLVELPLVSFDDIGGLEDLKSKIEEMVCWGYERREEMKRMGLKPPKGILLFGYPGVGKTLIAKAVANQAHANFINVDISNLIQAEVGESEKALAAIFRKATLSQPCIVFIDEIQSIFGHRSFVGESGKKMISQLIIELDKINKFGDENQVLLLAATNVPQSIDPAFLRPGRFDRILYVPPPNLSSRESILAKLFKKLEFSLDHSDPSLTPSTLAQLTHNFTGSDLKNLCDKAGMNSLLRKSSTITMQDFEKSLKESDFSMNEKMLQELEQWNSNRAR